MADPRPLLPWSTVARNLAEHGDNPVHTDAGAKAAGFDAAIVAGTTVHAYLTHPAAAAWGIDWLTHGWSEVRFLAPVFDADRVDCVPIDGTCIEARVGGLVRATLAVSLDAPIAGPHTGEPLPSLRIDLDDGAGSYGIRAGDDLDTYDHNEIAHPAVWSTIGNTVTKANCVAGPWVHVRSAITHLGEVPSDAVVMVESTITDRFSTKAGDRVVLDVRASFEGRCVAVIEHESIVRLATGPQTNIA